MQHSKPGKKLSPALKSVIDPIYRHDPQRYSNICRFVWTQQKQGWPDEAIAAAFELAGPNIHLVDNWWPYVTRLLPKAKGRATEAQSQQHKTEFGYIASEFIEFLKARQSA